MTDYVVRGDEEVYTPTGDIEKETLLPWVKVSATSVEEALETGRKTLQQRVCASRLSEPCSRMYVVRVDLVFDETGRKILYKSEKIKQQDRERAGEHFDLWKAVADGCSIDESGAGTCGG
jgi:hypothetical protein